MMFPSISSSLLQSSLPIPRLSAASETLFKRNHAFISCRRDATVPEKGFHPFLLSSNREKTFPIRPSLLESNEILGFGNWKTTSSVPKPGFRFVCSYDAKEESERNFPEKGPGFEWPIFERWDVPWEGQTVVLTMIACGISFVLTGFVEASVTSYLGLQIVNLGADEKAELLFVDQFIVTAVVLGVIYGLTKSFQPLPDDIFCYKWKEPFNLQKGWLLWAVLGIVVAFLAIALTGAALALFNGETPEREKDALIILLPLIGSSSISTAYLVGITGVLAPVLEETLFRGFLMVSLTKWLPTSVSVIISAAAFALAHLTPGEFPQLFVLGTALGFSYAYTRNLLTPITIHALWNSGVILILTFLQLQGYDIRDLLQGS
ncbi:hypothetical protein MRB53_021903 [Persea americana]|uniref:Uncharacterized protein n=1 Tax=Persea americana TaxID=3435 RepID=A0ACC2L5N5_PERAE|nr:hypothetical protein MRB53_021903 [Persea americana]